MKKRNTKLSIPEIITFRCERSDKLKFQKYCDINNLNESAVLRRIFREFLKKIEVE